MSEKQFTYLIGAGASAQAIPVINKFDSELLEFAMYIERFEFKEDFFNIEPKIETKPSELKENFVKKVNWLAEECKLHSSIDTFARKLFLANRIAELETLKCIVSEFLLIKQIRNGIDKRYDAFFAALLDKRESKLILPKNIKIVSWNYDKQIEYSIAQFKNTSLNFEIENFLQVFPRTESKEIEIDKFCLLKLNGTIGGTIRNQSQYIPIDIDFNLEGKKIDSTVEENILKNLLLRFCLIYRRISNKQFYSINKIYDEYPTINSVLNDKKREKKFCISNYL